jgi:hypothetical protein
METTILGAAMAGGLETERVDRRRQIDIVVERLRHMHHVDAAGGAFLDLHRRIRWVDSDRRNFNGRHRLWNKPFFARTYRVHIRMHPLRFPTELLPADYCQLELLLRPAGSDTETGWKRGKWLSRGRRFSSSVQFRTTTMLRGLQTTQNRFRLLSYRLTGGKFYLSVANSKIGPISGGFCRIRFVCYRNMNEIN